MTPKLQYQELCDRRNELCESGLCGMDGRCTVPCTSDEHCGDDWVCDDYGKECAEPCDDGDKDGDEVCFDGHLHACSDIPKQVADNFCACDCGMSTDPYVGEWEFDGPVNVTGTCNDRPVSEQESDFVGDPLIIARSGSGEYEVAFERFPGCSAAATASDGALQTIEAFQCNQGLWNSLSLTINGDIAQFRAEATSDVCTEITTLGVAMRSSPCRSAPYGECF